MSRKKKIQLRTVLIYCEGATEVVCAKYFLHTVARGRNKKLTIKDGRGGSPLELVNKAIADMEGFDEVYIWTDIDRPEINNALSLANDKSISVIKNNSNLEEEILRHLGVICGQIEDAKKKYRGLYQNDDLMEPKTYDKIFGRIQPIISDKSPFFEIQQIMK